MKKTNKQDDSFREEVHRRWEQADDEMDKRELKVYIDKDNAPNLKRMNESDEIGVEDVLVIGSYLELNKLHHTLHEGDAIKVLDGTMDLMDALPKDMPEEMKEVIKEISEVLKKKRSKK